MLINIVYNNIVSRGLELEHAKKERATNGPPLLNQTKLISNKVSNLIIIL